MKCALIFLAFVLLSTITFAQNFLGMSQQGVISEIKKYYGEKIKISYEEETLFWNPNDGLGSQFLKFKGGVCNESTFIPKDIGTLRAFETMFNDRYTKQSKNVWIYSNDIIIYRITLKYLIHEKNPTERIPFSFIYTYNN